MSEIVIDYSPRAPQWQIHDAMDSHRYALILSHRQLGKSVCAVNQVIKSAVRLKLPYGRFFYVGPYLKQVKTIAWSYLKRYGRPIPGIKINETELTLKLPDKPGISDSGAYIKLVGADNPDAIRGSYADGVIIDEDAMCKANLYTEIIRPMILARHGWVAFFSTPKGQNHFYQLYKFFKKKIYIEKDPEYWIGVFKASETGIIPEIEYNDIKAVTPANILAQEYECDFLAACSNTLISPALVEAACNREYNAVKIADAPVVIGIDPARFGDDSSVIVVRQGLCLLTADEFEGLDNVVVARKVLELAEKFKADAIFCDAGQGAGIIDILRHEDLYVHEVNFASKPNNPLSYLNRRAEIWDQMRIWLESGASIKLGAEKKSITERLAPELSTPAYDYVPGTNIKRLESKDSIKGRLGWSPDVADALAVTFSEPVKKAGNTSNYNYNYNNSGRGRRTVKADYDPLDSYK